MKKVPNWVYIILFIGLLIASKFMFFSKKEEKTGAKPKVAPVLAVNYFVARSGELGNEVFATGKVGAMNQVDLLPETGGKVTAIYFKEGETVEKGSPLVKLNDADVQAQLLKTRNQMRLSEQKLARLKKLLDIKGVSQEEYDLEESTLASLKADEAYYLAQIAKTNISAPFTGQVGLKNISEGSYVNTGTPIVSLVQMKPLFIEFTLPEKYASLIKKGAQVNFSVDNHAGADTYTAAVFAIDPKIDENTRSLRARALYSGDAALFPGNYVKVFVNLGSSASVLMVPTQCVIPTLKGQKLFVCKNGEASEVPVKTGVRTDTRIQITEGIATGDTIVATGLLAVKKETKLKLLKPVQ